MYPAPTATYGVKLRLGSMLISSVPVVTTCDPLFPVTSASDLTTSSRPGKTPSSAFQVVRKLASDALIASLLRARSASWPLAQSIEASAVNRGDKEQSIRSPTLPPEPRSTKRLLSMESNGTIAAPSRAGTAPLRIVAPSPKNQEGTGS